MKLSASLFVAAAAAASLLPTAFGQWNECEDPADECPDDGGEIEKFKIRCVWPGDKNGFNIDDEDENLMKIKYKLNDVDPNLFSADITDCSDGAYASPTGTVDPSVDTLVTFTNDGPVLSDPKTKYCAMVTLKLCPTADNCADVAMATCSRDISAPTSGDHEATDGFDSTITKTNRVNAKDADEDRDATFIIECDNPIQWEQIPCVRLTSDDPDFEWSITSIVGNLAALLGPFAETGDLTPTLSLPTPFATSIEICFGVPIDYFVAGAVEITVAADWQYSPSPSRRALRGLQDGDITSGEISETLEMNVDTSGVPPELLGTAAGAEYYKYSFVGMCLAAGAAVAAV